MRAVRSNPVVTTMGLMPNKPKTTLRNVRVDDELWQAAQAAAEARGQTVSEAIRRFLKRYAKSEH